MTALSRMLGRASAPAGGLEDLFAKAEAFGAVDIFSNAERPLPKRYCAKIEFITTKGISLKASSDFGMALGDALRQAIDRAEVIRGQFK